MNSDDYKLDNPVWYSLSESHRTFGVSFEDIKFYHPDYCAFGGFQPAQNVKSSIDKYSRMADNFFIVGEKPPISLQVNIRQELICLQMVINHKIELEGKENITPLSPDQQEPLFELVNLVQPGYFKRKTFHLGDYFGIFKENALISVSGERMKMNDFVEVSSIVTHPDHTGKGYAKQLIAHTVNRIMDQHKTPYLHVLETNKTAIHLYEKLGFSIRRKISFWNITQQP